MDIKVICDCGKEMIKIEDGRDQSTKAIMPKYPQNGMGFVCSCGKFLDLTYTVGNCNLIDF